MNYFTGVKERQDKIDALALDTFIKMDALLLKLNFRSRQAGNEQQLVEEQQQRNQDQDKERLQRVHIEFTQRESFDENCEKCQWLSKVILDPDKYNYDVKDYAFEPYDIPKEERTEQAEVTGNNENVE